MKNMQSIFVYPKYSCLIPQRINVTFTMRVCSISAAARHNLPRLRQRPCRFCPIEW
jgi:hypothetical protein